MTKSRKIDLKALVALIRKSHSICIATHENPDGDGIGSILALAKALKHLKKKVVLYTADPVPKMYHFLPGWKTITQQLTSRHKFDLSLIVDLGEIERVGKAFKDHPGRGLTVSIDHHLRGQHNCDLDFCLPKQASSGEVVFKIIKALRVKIDTAMAKCIFTAMVTDTGSFRYSNTTEETFIIASELMRFKVDPWEISRNCFDTFSRARMELLKRLIGRMRIHENLKVAWLDIRNSDFEFTGATNEDSEGFINYPRSIEGIEVAIAIKEVHADEFKVSLRSKLYVDVARIAEKFGGGGHIRAAGCTLHGNYEFVLKTMLDAINSHLRLS